MNNFFLWFITIVNSCGLVFVAYGLSLLADGTNEKFRNLKSMPVIAPKSVTFEQIKNYLDNYQKTPQNHRDEDVEG